MVRGAWRATIYRVARVRHDLETKQQYVMYNLFLSLPHYSPNTLFTVVILDIGSSQGSLVLVGCLSNILPDLLCVFVCVSICVYEEPFEVPALNTSGYKDILLCKHSASITLKKMNKYHLLPSISHSAMSNYL